VNEKSEIEFQKDILAYFIQHPDMFRLYKSKIPTSMFENDAIRNIFLILKGSYERLGRFCTLIEACRTLEYLSKTSPELNLSELVIDYHYEVIGEIYKRETTDETLEHLRQYITKYHLTNLSQQLLTVQDRQTLIAVKDQIEDLEVFTSEHIDVGTTPLKDVNTEKIKNWYEDLFGGHHIPIGFSTIDNLIRGGGLREGDFVLLEGYTGGCKTALAMNIAVNMIRYGARVIYYALDNEESEIIERLYSILSGKGIDDEAEFSILADSISKVVTKDIQDKFILKSLTPYNTTVSYLLSHITLVEEIYGKVDVIILDSGDSIKADRHYNQEYIELKHVFEKLRGLGKSNCANLRVITTTQGNRESLQAEVITLKQMSGSYAKAWPASLAISINLQPKDRIAGRARLCVLKNTRGKAFKICPVTIDWDTFIMKIDPAAAVTDFIDTKKKKERRTSFTPVLKYQ